MRRVVTAFAIGLGMGLSITAVRVVVRARKGLPTTWNADRTGRPAPSGANGANGYPANGEASNGHPPNGHPPNGHPAYRAPSFAELLERLRAALAAGAQAMRDTEAELRSKVFDGGR